MVSDDAMTATPRPLVEPQSGIQPRYDLTVDEQIRCKALECAARIKASGFWRVGDDFMEKAAEFEDYLRNGRST